MDALSEFYAVAAETVMFAGLLFDPILGDINNSFHRRGYRKLAAMGFESDFMTREPILMTTLDIFAGGERRCFHCRG